LRVKDEIAHFPDVFVLGVLHRHANEGAGFVDVGDLLFQLRVGNLPRLKDRLLVFLLFRRLLLLVTLQLLLALLTFALLFQLLLLLIGLLFQLLAALPQLLPLLFELLALLLGLLLCAVVLRSACKNERCEDNRNRIF